MPVLGEGFYLCVWGGNFLETLDEDFLNVIYNKVT